MFGGSRSEVEVVEAAPGKKTLCVIGAGASGLTVMKEVTALGHTVQCFDENVRIGGVYTKSYDRTMLTTSSLLTAYSDYSDGREDSPKFWSDEEYLNYLDGFATEFGLYEHIEFRSTVKSVTKCPTTGKWLVKVALGGCYVWPHRSTFLLGRGVPESAREEAATKGAATLDDFYGKAATQGFEKIKGSYVYDYYDHVTGEKRRMDPSERATAKTLAFDAVAVCTGTNTWASLPEFEGQDEYVASGGEIVHSENYKKPEVFKDKRILIVGAGESGSDICNEIAEEAAKVAIAVRGKHGHIIPRKQSDGRVTDLNTNRCRYSNPYVLGDWVGYVTQLAKKTVAKYGGGRAKDASERAVLQKIGELNMSQGTSAFSKFGCKNEGFVTAMVTKGAELHRDTFVLKGGKKAVFADGSEFVADAVVACTGYKNSFPMFEADDVKHDQVSDGVRVADLNKRYGQNPRKLYKQIFCPLFQTGELAFFGFARPAFGAIPPTAEMQSRFFALVFDGVVTLPSREVMETTAAKDQANWEYRFGYDAKRVKGLVDFQLYCDDLAEQFGALPPLRRLFFTKPKIWWKIMFGPFTMHQYRLVGPYANPELAARVYSKQPVGDLLESSITATFLIMAKTLSLLGFKQFTPNNF
ncbi:hypothetical protein CTAYLR_006564 [Chrysophaeum taylorii]|uniref:Flavin-containing monooxygenase n=1 Tax=Chrysophaeum taylorii TaxID=2483200 RepID=A0AAD7XJK8_9STRA|nr:hypothetical protein CTAYLR_006564 [Chrysophaeum taylorii]